MRTRNGKIARLPATLRHQLNERLDNAEEGPELLGWLNALPEVQQVLQEHFQGVPISKQNLSEWRQGGFQEWLLRRELCAQAENLAETGADMREQQPHTDLADAAAALLALRFGNLLAQWNGQADDAVQTQARLLNGLCKGVVSLQKSVHQARKDRVAAIQLEEQEQERQRKQKRDQTHQTYFRMMFRNQMAEKYGNDEKAKRYAEGFSNLLWYDGESPLRLWPDDPEPAPVQSGSVKPSQTDSSPNSICVPAGGVDSHWGAQNGS